MRLAGIVSLAISVCSVALSQAPVSPTPSDPQSVATTPQPPSYANYSLMLVNPVPGGGGVVLMHDTKNQLELVPVNNVKQALDMGFVAVRAGELDELIGALREENARLEEENAQLRSQAPAPQVIAISPQGPSQAEIAERRREQMEAEKAARRQQLIQAWMGIQNMNRSAQPYQLPMPVNPNANRLRTNCTTTQLGNTSTTNCN